jgi:small subunit ribosomal protein S9
MATERYYSTGRRKNAIARVWIQAGSGNVTINNKPMNEYLGRKVLVMEVMSPLRSLHMDDKIDVIADAQGGGLHGQAGAVKLGIARALMVMDPELRASLRKGGYLTRDPRVKERKKYGRKRARRGFQFVKR